MKKYWWVILVVVILIAVNIFCAIIFSSYNNISNILTVISGWVSGIATLGIGIIAFSQAIAINEMLKETDIS